MEVEALAGKQCRLVMCGKDHMACTVIHGWVPDEEAAACMACKKNFTTIRRRVSDYKPQSAHRLCLFSTSAYSTIAVSVEGSTVARAPARGSLCWTEASVTLSESVTSATMNSPVNYMTDHHP